MDVCKMSLLVNAFFNNNNMKNSHHEIILDSTCNDKLPVFELSSKSLKIRFLKAKLQFISLIYFL